MVGGGDLSLCFRRRVRKKNNPTSSRTTTTTIGTAMAACKPESQDILSHCFDADRASAEVDAAALLALIEVGLDVPVVPEPKDCEGTVDVDNVVDIEEGACVEAADEREVPEVFVADTFEDVVRVPEVLVAV
jgi:hypothetical protein